MDETTPENQSSSQPAAEREPYSIPPGPRLNLGCGPVQPDDWINVDASLRARVSKRLNLLDRALTSIGVLSKTEFGPQVRIHDVTKPLPYADGSVSVIYAGELWEHLEPEHAVGLTKECHRILTSDGVLRVRVPDGVEFWSRYLELVEKEKAKPRSERNVEKVKLHVQMFFAEICTRRPLLHSMGHYHKWQYDEVQLIDLFESTGFREVARMGYRQSRIDDIEKVERAEFLIVEGIK